MIITIVSYSISKGNDNQLVMDTVEAAMSSNPGATPIIHSDWGYQHLLKKAYGFTGSRPRSGKCLDNQPIESFWGVLKTEFYYRKEFASYDELKKVLIGIFIFIKIKGMFLNLMD
ncbi:IS3 family transposase [Listeria monocytogenes]|nr:IS3 family transposase [Listeria monocytogenes]